MKQLSEFLVAAYAQMGFPTNPRVWRVTHSRRHAPFYGRITIWWRGEFDRGALRIPYIKPLKAFALPKTEGPPK